MCNPLSQAFIGKCRRVTLTECLSQNETASSLPPGRFASLAEIMAQHERETLRIARKLVRVLPTIGCRVPKRLREAAGVVHGR